MIKNKNTSHKGETSGRNEGNNNTAKKKTSTSCKTSGASDIGASREGAGTYNKALTRRA